MNVYKATPVSLLAAAMLVLAACQSQAPLPDDGFVNAPDGQPGAASSWTADEASIRAMIQASAEAFNRGDLPGHLSIYDASITFMTKDGPRPGIAPIEAAFRKAYFHDGLPKQQLRFEQLAVRPLGTDHAMATGRFVLSGGGEPDQIGWFTLVWMRTAAGWRTIHDHSS